MGLAGLLIASIITRWVVEQPVNTPRMAASQPPHQRHRMQGTEGIAADSESLRWVNRNPGARGGAEGGLSSSAGGWSLLAGNPALTAGCGQT